MKEKRAKKQEKEERKEEQTEEKEQENEWDILEEELSEEVETLQQEQREVSGYEKRKKPSRFPNWLRVSFLLFFILFFFGLHIVKLAAFGRDIVYLVVNSLVKIREFDGEKLAEEFEENKNDGRIKLNPEDIQWEKTNDVIRHEKDVINILLVGEEAIGDGSSRGRTDSIMLGTINVKQKAIKLTSFMRDTYVQIPGYSDNRLNAAYHNGGIPLLKETLEKNFDIEINGAVLVNFDGFEMIIDKLGGVELTLTASEAHYLNTTNYISNPTYRNVREGRQTLNGNQALGYMRIRYVKTENNDYDDFGRTSRQRTLLNAIFEKYKTKELSELISLLYDILPLVTTDIQTKNLVNYLTTVMTINPTKLDTLRIPADKEYDPVYVRKMAVLVPHFPENIQILHQFIFGEETEETIANQEIENTTGTGISTSIQMSP